MFPSPILEKGVRFPSPVLGEDFPVHASASMFPSPILEKGVRFPSPVLGEDFPVHVSAGRKVLGFIDHAPTYVCRRTL